jgi:dTDP-4-dehydrorhamnose 3,5-epimerase
VIFRETTVTDAWIVEPHRYGDKRGVFARTWCASEFAARGLCARFVQASVSFNPRRGTLRGLHYQAAPHTEVKLVRCTRGAIYDVAVDLRSGSRTFCRYAAVVLTADNHLALYIPEGCAHGFQTLEDDTEVLYQMSEFYAPEAACGVRWDDPAFAIGWPPARRIIAQRDLEYPDFTSAHAVLR